MTKWMLAATVVAVLAGCEVTENPGNPNQNEGTSDAGSEPVDGSGDGFSIALLRASELGEGINSTSGKRYVEIDVRLTNLSRSDSLPLNPLLFTVRTLEGMDYVADGMPREGTCDATARVAIGGSPQCKLRFSMPWAQHPKELRYAPTPLESPAVAPLTPTACSVCGDACVDLQTDPDHCGKFGASASWNNQTCKEGTIVCTNPELTGCGPACVDLKRDSYRCGACGKGVPWDGW